MACTPGPALTTGGRRRPSDARPRGAEARHTLPRSPEAVTTGRRLSSPLGPHRQAGDFPGARLDSTAGLEQLTQAHWPAALPSGSLDPGLRGDGSRRGPRPRPPCLEALSPLTSRRRAAPSRVHLKALRTALASARGGRGGRSTGRGQEAAR